MATIASIDPIRSALRWRRPLLMAATAALVFAACSSASSPAGPAGFGDGTITDGAGGGSEVSGPATQGSGRAGAAASAAPVPAAQPGSQAGGDGGLSQALAAQVFIVKTGSLTLEVPAIDPALLKARTAIAGLGGYISGSDQSNSGDRTVASVTYRLPADRWEDALDALRGLATTVIGLKTSTDEVTGQVVDLGARIENLQSTERALQAIMAKATKIQDILEVQNQLTDVQGQIEQLSSQQAHLKDQAAMSTLTVLYQLPAVPAVKETTKGWDFAAELDRATAQLIGFGQSLATAGIWFAVVVLPVLLVVGLFVLLFAVLIRRLAPLPQRPAGPPAVVGGPEA